MRPARQPFASPNRFRPIQPQQKPTPKDTKSTAASTPPSKLFATESDFGPVLATEFRAASKRDSQKKNKRPVLKCQDCKNKSRQDTPSCRALLAVLGPGN